MNNPADTLAALPLMQQARHLKKMRDCAPLLPAPGDQVVIECLDEIDRLRAALASLKGEAVDPQQIGHPTNRYLYKAMLRKFGIPEQCNIADALKIVSANPPPSPAPQGGGEDARNLVRSALTTVLGDAMDCTRVWDAWRVGTMTESDFCLIVEDSDRLEEIVDAVLLASPPAQQPGEVGEAPGSYSWMAEVIRSAADYIQVVGSQNYHAHLRNIAAYIAALAPKEKGNG